MPKDTPSRVGGGLGDQSSLSRGTGGFESRTVHKQNSLDTILCEEYTFFTAQGGLKNSSVPT